MLAGYGLEAETIAAVGEPCAEILDAAEVMAAEIIVIGRRQRRRPSLRGSLTAKLVRSAERDVLIVHHGG